MPRFITLAGRKQVGKDTSAKKIARIIGSRLPDKTFLEEWAEPTLNVHIVHFADALKEACVHMFGIDRNDMETEEGKKKLTDIVWPAKQLRQMGQDYEVIGYAPHHPQAGAPKYMTVREVLQFVGTDLFRNQMDPDIWVKSIFHKKYPANDIVIVADCRFPNEAEFARENGLLIKIERDTGQRSDLHISELALDNYEHFNEVVDNNGDFSELKEKLMLVLKKHNFIA